MSDAKKVYQRCFIRSFYVVDTDTTTKSWNSVVKALTAGQKVFAELHVIGHGTWKSSEIVNMELKYLGGYKVIETEEATYICQGIETTKKANSVLFLCPDDVSLGTENENTFKVEQLVKTGKNVRARVILKRGETVMTTKVLEVNRSKHRFTTMMGIVYRW